LNGTRHFPLGLGGPAEPINIIGPRKVYANLGQAYGEEAI